VLKKEAATVVVDVQGKRYMARLWSLPSFLDMHSIFNTAGCPRCLPANAKIVAMQSCKRPATS
jgi:hypothetical protein